MTNLQKRILTSLIIFPLSIFVILKGGYILLSFLFLVFFIANYELSAKILEDPVKMERKINNGTKHIFEEIEKLSDTVDNLDDGLQLQHAGN